MITVEDDREVRPVAKGYGFSIWGVSKSLVEFQPDTRSIVARSTFGGTASV